MLKGKFARVLIVMLAAGVLVFAPFAASSARADLGGLCSVGSAAFGAVGWGLGYSGPAGPTTVQILTGAPEGVAPLLDGVIGAYGFMHGGLGQQLNPLFGGYSGPAGESAGTGFAGGLWGAGDGSPVFGGQGPSLNIFGGQGSSLNIFGGPSPSSSGCSICP